MEVLKDISESLHRGNHEAVAELTRQAIDSGLATAEILDGALLAGMDLINPLDLGTVKGDVHDIGKSLMGAA